MKFKILVKKLLFGIAQIDVRESSINGRIEVFEDISGKRNLIIGGLPQSGEKVERLWKNTFNKFKIKPSQNCLILGLGAGSLAMLISKKNPSTEIVGIEIDPVVVEIGKKYFKLSRINNLKIIIDDAILAINNIAIKQYNNFNLILVDLYLGDNVPEGVESKIFLDSLNKILSNDGKVIFNRLYYGEKIAGTDKLENLLIKSFNSVESHYFKGNKLFYCHN